MTEVPKGYFTTIRGRTGKQLKFYDNLLQITMRAHGMIFCLDTRQEVEAIENIDMLQDPDTMVNTGFIMSASTCAYQDGEKFHRRIQTFTNENCNLSFQKIQDRYIDETEFKISGMLYRTFSEMDLGQL